MFTNDAFCLILWDELFYYAGEYNVDLLAFVIMPEHLHCLIWPQGEKIFSDYIRGVKSHLAKLILEHLNRRGPLTSPSARPGQGTRPMKGEGNKYPTRRISDQTDRIWQPGLFPYLIGDTNKLEEKLEYIKNNPVEAGLVEKPEDYQWLYVNPKIFEIE
ncbi:transposase [Patescibacteria group bacterium]|nr:transposase [Patescibacteria group bacterium]MBU1907171.1 transposase [Patescibacteria group bacterium]